jgi:hypothetical protein
MKNKKLNTFVRFGGLNLKKQKGFGNDTFHSPPAPIGIYCMPLIAQELFLVGDLSYQKNVMPKAKKEYFDTTEGAENYEKRTKNIRRLKRKEFYKNTGNIWHHLREYTDNNEIIEEHNSWCKTSIKAWQKAFSKMSLNLRYGEDDSFKITNINVARGITGYYSKDHCEVFFDEKV